jgi:hypothetical protein
MNEQKLEPEDDDEDDDFEDEWDDEVVYPLGGAYLDGSTRARG